MPTVVGTALKDVGTASTNIAVTVNQDLPVGTRLVIAADSPAGSSGINFSASDTHSNTYTQIWKNDASTANNRVAQLTCSVTTQINNGDDITVALASGTHATWLVAIVSVPSSGFDAATTKNTNGSASSSVNTGASPTAGQADQYVIGAVAWSGTPTFTATGGATVISTIDAPTAIRHMAVTYERVSTVATRSVTGTLSGSTAWAAGLVAANTTVAAATRDTTWRVLAAITSTRATTWNVAAGLVSVTASRITTWRTLSAATSSRATTWRTLAAALSTRATTWRTLASPTSSRSTTWRVLARATSSRLTTWRVLGSATSTRATTWRTLAQTSATRQTTWDVLSVVTAVTRSTTWRVLKAATATRSTTWNVKAAVTATRSTTWRVLKSVASTRATTWNVTGVVTAARQTTWRVLSSATSSRTTTWDVLKSVTSSRATTWRTLARTTATRVTTWNVDALVVVTKTVSTTWRTLSRATSSRQTTWDTLTSTQATRDTTWRVLTPATSSRDTEWRVLEEATSSRTTTWRVTELVTATREAIWRVLARVISTRATTWNVLGVPPPLVTNPKATLGHNGHTATLAVNEHTGAAMDAVGLNDLLPDWSCVLADGAQPYDPTGADSVTINCWRNDVLLFSRAPSTVTADGTVTMAWQSGDTNDPGPLKFKVVVVKSGFKAATFPPQGFMVTRVHPASP